MRLKGELLDHRQNLELFAPRRPVTWAEPCYATLDRHVAMAYLEDWKEAVRALRFQPWKHC